MSSSKCSRPRRWASRALEVELSLASRTQAREKNSRGLKTHTDKFLIGQSSLNFKSRKATTLLLRSKNQLSLQTKRKTSMGIKKNRKTILKINKGSTNRGPSRKS